MDKQKVFENAWRDFKIKKKHKGYENWTFGQSLYYAHKRSKNSFSNTQMSM